MLYGKSAFSLLTLTLILGYVWRTQAVTHAADQPPSQPTQKKPLNDLSDDAEVARQLMQLPDGFEAQLVASEPDVVNPLQINFDARGRLYVLCAPRYPQILPGQNPGDYVLRLEDFDKTGKARTARIVVDGLMVPTGMIPGDGGVYVGQAEALVHFRIPKGMDRYDQKRVVLSGFGTADTHHTVNTLRWGPDGSLYFNQGVYIHSSVETPYGVRQLIGGGIWQLRTDRLKLEVYDRSILPNNTWGHAFDSWGQSFISSAWPGALHWVLPDSPLHKTTQPELIPSLKMTQIGGERHCGLEIVSGRHFPDEWQGNLLTGDFLSHRVYRYALSDDGQRYLARALQPLVVSKHRKFRPVDIKMGPDGAVYIADLYQQIIQHNQVDFRDPRRDHSRGRIWRIVRKDRPLLPMPSWMDGSVEEILVQLKAPEQWTRQQAKRTLAERDPKTIQPALDQWIEKLNAKETDLSHHLLEALWTQQSIDRVDAAFLTRLLHSEDFHLRAAATRVLGACHDKVPDAIPLLARQVIDPHPRVRLEGVLALSRIPSAEAVAIGMRALDQPTDPFLDFSLQKLARLHKPYWLPEFQKGRLTFDGNARSMTFALQAIGGDAMPTLADLVVKDKVPTENLPGVLQLIALLGSAEQQNLALNQVLDPSRLVWMDRVRILEALNRSARERKVSPRGDLNRIIPLFDEENIPLSSAALRLAGVWKLEGQRERLQKWASSAKGHDERRPAAVSALVDLGGPRSIEQLEQLSIATNAYEVRLHAITGLSQLDVIRAARHAGTFLQEPPPAGQDPGELFTAFLQRREGSQALAKILQQGKPATDSARVGLRVLVGLGTPAPELQSVLQATLGKIEERRKLDALEMKRWIHLVKSQGDATRGEAVFRRSTLGCTQCHALGGAGGRVGPDLSGIGSSAQLDYLIESVFLPSKVVREGYTTAHITTKDGRVLSGVLHRESPKELVLKDPIRDEIVIPVQDIDEKRIGGSLMPDGLDQSLTDAELADLFRFLGELGKPGSFAITHTPVVRRWQYYNSPPGFFQKLDELTLGQLLNEESALSWKPIYAKASGHLPLTETLPAKDTFISLVRFQIEVVAQGTISLRLSDAQGVTIWVDGKIATSQSLSALELARGVHTVAMRVDIHARKDSLLRCELLPAERSKAQVKLIDGR